MDDFASSFRQRRKFARWTQQKLAEELGVSKSCINHFESGKRSPSEEDARKLARILGADEERWAFLATRAPKLLDTYQDYPEQTSLFILDLQREAPPKNDPLRADIKRRSASLYAQLLEAAGMRKEDDKSHTD